jgi:hypothetical protein
MGSDFLLCGFTRAIFGEEKSGGETFLSFFVTKRVGWVGL